MALQTCNFWLLKTLTDGLEWFGLLWCFYQLFGLSFWRHPFTAEDPLVNKWRNATFLQIWWRIKLIYIFNGLRVRTFSAHFHVNYSFNYCQCSSFCSSVCFCALQCQRSEHEASSAAAIGDVPLSGSVWVMDTCDPCQFESCLFDTLSEHICRHELGMMVTVKAPHPFPPRFLVSVKSNPQSLTLILLPSAEPFRGRSFTAQSKRRKISRQNWERSQTELELCYENWQTNRSVACCQVDRVQIRLPAESVNTSLNHTESNGRESYMSCVTLRKRVSQVPLGQIDSWESG